MNLTPVERVKDIGYQGTAGCLTLYSEGSFGVRDAGNSLGAEAEVMTTYLLEIAGYALAVFVAAQIYEKVVDYQKRRKQPRLKPSNAAD